MPQEFHVIQCYSCNVFQVDIVKKVPKWPCKMCGEKQSVKKVYSKGSAKECRLHVQKLNEKRIRLETEMCEQLSHECPLESEMQREQLKTDHKENSKWLEFLQNNDTNEETVYNGAENSHSTYIKSKSNELIFENVLNFKNNYSNANENEMLKSIDQHISKREKSREEREELEMNNSNCKKFKSDVNDQKSRDVCKSVQFENIFASFSNHQDIDSLLEI